MTDSFDGSFRIYIHSHSVVDADNVEEAAAGDAFSREVDNIKDDVKNVEHLYYSLLQSNQEIKDAQSAFQMKEIRSRLNSDLDHLLKLAKQINKKFDALVASNAAQRRLSESSSDETRARMISDLAGILNHATRTFQSLRVQMENDHRQIIENRYFAITKEKATAEAIDNLIAIESPAIALQKAEEEHGRDVVADAVEEIEERRNAMREIRSNLMALHQIMLGIATPLERQSSKGQGATPGNVESYTAVAESGTGAAPGAVESYTAAAKSGTGGGLNDYERETRRQAYMAIAIALVIIIGLIVALLKIEDKLENSQYM